MSIELVDTGWLTVKADFLLEESVSVFYVRNNVFGNTPERLYTESQLWRSLA